MYQQCTSYFLTDCHLAKWVKVDCLSSISTNPAQRQTACPRCQRRRCPAARCRSPAGCNLSSTPKTRRSRQRRWRSWRRFPWRWWRWGRRRCKSAFPDWGPTHKTKYLPSVITDKKELVVRQPLKRRPGANPIKLFIAVIYEFSLYIKCLSLASLSSLV